MSFHHGRGSEAKGMHFYETIQLRQLQDHELKIPTTFAERYWKDVSNPISLRLPNESVCKMSWVKYGDDIWLQNWERFARSLRCGDLIVFQYRGGSEFHVIILDDSKLEIDYSSIRCSDEQEAEEIDDGNYVEVNIEVENAKQPLKKKKINLNDRVTTAATPQGANINKRKINKNATQKKVLEANRNRGGRSKKAKNCANTKDANKRSFNNSHPGENPNFTLKLSRTSVDCRRRQLLLTIPNQFSKEYMNELLQGNATIRSVGEDRTWYVKLCFDKRYKNFKLFNGWKSFAQEHNLQVGDVCKFEMTQREPLSFTITIDRATKEPCPDPEQFEGCGHAENQQVQVRSETSPVENMDYVGIYGEGNSRNCPKTEDLRNSVSDPNLHYKFETFVTSLEELVIPNEFMKSHNIFSGNSVELKVGEGSWFVEVSYNQHLDYGWFIKGWKEFVRECKVKIGDTCLFEMIDDENHVFKVSIILDG